MHRWSLVVTLLGGCAARHGDAPPPPAGDDPEVVDDSDAPEVVDDSDATEVGDDTDDPDDPACAPLVDRAFRSVEEHECGLCPKGPCTCTWGIAFTATTWSWTGSDYGEQGTYTCADGVIVGTNHGFEHHGVYDPNTHRLTWDAIVYE